VGKFFSRESGKDDMGILGILVRTKLHNDYFAKRRRPRLNCATETEFADAKGNAWSCKIVNLSENCFGIVTASRLRMGHAVNIIHPSVAARVV
jgi:hypothetical protein